MNRPPPDVIRPEPLPEDLRYDLALRPASFADFVGQDKIRDNLGVFVTAARGREEPLDHTLFFGPPGLGKTTLAHIVAAEMQVGIKATSGPSIERPGDLAGLLTNLAAGDVLFIDEIHRVNRVVEEYLYGAMEDFHIDIVTGDGPRANSVRLKLEPFTLVGATTRSGLLSAPFRSRFGISLRLDYYAPAELSRIVRRSAGILGVSVGEPAAALIAARSRGTPRVANRLLRRVRDFAQVESLAALDPDFTVAALDRLDVDPLGLDDMDKKILETIMHKFSGGPVGLKTLALAVGEEADTLEEIYEPFLVREGFLLRTPRGRQATRRAYAHFGAEPPPEAGAAPGQTSLF